MDPRSLERTDFDKGHLDLLSQLSPFDTATVTRAAYEDFVATNGHTVWVIEIDGRIAASATLIIEQKLIHSLGKAAHIEDVVVHPDHRKHGIGKKLVEDLVGKAKEEGCYKVILDCSEGNTAFYEKCGFLRKGCCMAVYF